VDGRSRWLCLFVLLSPDTSGFAAQMRVLADLAQPLLAITDQLLGDVGVGQPHGILLEMVALNGVLLSRGGSGRG
jgi:hypothetical protein